MIPKTYYIKNQRITLPDNLILDKNTKLTKKKVLHIARLKLNKLNNM